MTKVAIFIFFTALVLRLAFLSPWLEDWDSVQFALALHDYDIIQHQPHPPGYPIYVLMGRFLNSFINNDTLALTNLSALLGAASSIPFYLLAREMLTKRLALFSTLIFLATPLHWLLSELAMTDVPGMFFLLLSALILYKAGQNKQMLFLGSFLAGLTIGVRFTIWPILGSLLLLAAVKQRGIKKLFLSGILLLAGILVWFLPLLILTGTSELIEAYRELGGYVVRHDSIFSSNLTLLSRLARIKSLFLAGFSIYFLPFALFGLWHLTKRRPGSFPQQFLASWLISYFIAYFSFYNLEVPRHLFPFLPPLILLAFLWLDRLQRKAFAIAVYLILTVLILATAYRQVYRLKILTPPTIAPVLYVKENFNPQNTILITTFTFRQFQYYAPEFTNFYGSENVPEKLDKDVVIIDFWGIKKQIPALEGYNILDAKEFRGPETIFPRVTKTNLYILKRQT